MLNKERGTLKGLETHTASVILLSFCCRYNIHISGPSDNFYMKTLIRIKSVCWTTWKRTLFPSRSSVCQRVVLMGVQGLGSRGTSWPISSTLNCSTAELHGSTRTPGDNCFRASCRHSPGSVRGGATHTNRAQHRGSGCVEVGFISFHLTSFIFCRSV